MLLQTSRLIIRNFKDSDIESFVAYRNIPEVAKYQGWKIPYPRERAVQLVDEMRDMEFPEPGHWLQLALVLKESGRMIGDVGVRIKKDDSRQAVIGFTLAPEYWRMGYTTEAVTALLDFLFEELDLHRVMADCDTENTGSWRMLEKVGFRREAHFVDSFLMGEDYASEYIYGMLQREWRARKNLG